MPQDTQAAQSPQSAQQKQLQRAELYNRAWDDVEEENSGGSTAGLQPTLYDKVYEMAEKFATTRIGQYTIERGDRILRMIETTAKWSLPQDNAECRVERPMPWLPFLSMIIVLRLARIWLSVGAVMIGNRPVMPQDMIYFIQTRRRKLRSLRMHGIKEIRRHELEAISSEHEGGLISTLKTLLSSAICRPGLQRQSPIRHVFIYHGQEHARITGVQQANKRPRDDEHTEQNLSIEQMLTKYANENSDDDSDFLPNREEEDATTSSGTSSGSGSGCSDTETENRNRDQAVVTLPTESTLNQTASDQHTDSTLNSTTNEHNASVVQKKTNGSRPMPKPLNDIKTEVISDLESGNEQASSPLENGPSHLEKRDTDVVKRAATGTGTHQTHAHAHAHTHTHTPNGNGLVAKPKATAAGRGHQGEAMIRPRLSLMPAFDTTATAAPIECDAPHIHNDTQHPNVPSIHVQSSQPVDVVCLSLPSSNVSTASSSSLASLVTSDEFVSNENSPEPRTPTSTTSFNFECDTLLSASSTEDVFYSPIGS